MEFMFHFYSSKFDEGTPPLLVFVKGINFVATVKYTPHLFVQLKIYWQFSK